MCDIHAHHHGTVYITFQRLFDGIINTFYLSITLGMIWSSFIFVLSFCGNSEDDNDDKGWQDDTDTQYILNTKG